MRFLNALQIPLIAVLRDSQNYVQAASEGIGVCEMPAHKVQKDMPQLKLIFDWLDRWHDRRLDAMSLSGFEHLPGAQVLTPTHHQDRQQG